jgi:hypothetical protein
LIGGAIRPRMHWYLKTCAELMSDYTADMVDFHLFVPPSVLGRLPRGTLSGWHERGMGAVLRTCLKLLYEKRLLSVAAVRAKALGGADWSSVQSMLDAGLKVEFVLDYLFHRAEDSFRTGEGHLCVFDNEDFQEDIDAIAPHALDECYDVAFHMCCSEGGEPLRERGPFRENRNDDSSDGGFQEGDSSDGDW